jgi:hypothetical protein
MEAWVPKAQLYALWSPRPTGLPQDVCNGACAPLIASTAQKIAHSVTEREGFNWGRTNSSTGPPRQMVKSGSYACWMGVERGNETDGAGLS